MVKPSKTKLKYAIAYFSSQIDASENKDLEIRSPEGGAADGDRTTLSCKTRNGLQWSGRRDAGLLRDTRLVLLSRCRATGRVSIAAASADAFRFVPTCVADEPTTEAAAAAAAATAAAAAASNTRKRSSAAATAMYEEFGSTAKKRRIAEARRLNATVSAKELKAAAATATRRLEKSATPGTPAGTPGTPAGTPGTPAGTPGTPAAGPSDALLPPRDPAARQPAGVYGPDAVCPPRLRAALLPEAERLAASGPPEWAQWRSEAVYPDDLLLQRLPHMPTEPAGRLDHCVRLAMLACMRRFYGLGYRQVNRKGPLPDLPEEVGRHLLDCYTAQMSTSTGSHRALPPMMKDKQLVHMIILCLQLDGYSTDTAGLMAEFRLTAVRLKKLLSVIGCEVVAAKVGGRDVKVARLKAPIA